MGNRNQSHDAALIAAVAQSISLAGTLRVLGMRVGGGNYATLKRSIAELGIDTSHWLGKGHRRGSSEPVVRRRPLSSLLRRDFATNSNRLRKRLTERGLFNAQCAMCGLSTWLGQAIALELDHQDGDRTNNELANLRLLCPNCHALTPTYRGRNVRGPRSKTLSATRASAIIAPDARVVELVDTRDLRNLSAPAETPEMTPVKFGESPG